MKLEAQTRQRQRRSYTITRGNHPLSLTWTLCSLRRTKSLHPSHFRKPRRNSLSQSQHGSLSLNLKNPPFVTHHRRHHHHFQISPLTHRSLLQALILISSSPPPPQQSKTPQKILHKNTNDTLHFCRNSVGDKLPDATFSYFDADGELQTTTVSSLTAGKKAILFAVPGAFTPTCSQKHLPGFMEKSSELKAKGVETIACISVNDAFVMRAWKENLGMKDEVLLLSDGNGEFTKAIGCELDLSDKPVALGVRSRRYAILAEDGVVKVLNLEEGGAFTFSGAEDMLKLL